MTDETDEIDLSPETGMQRAQAALTEVSRVLNDAGLSFFLAVTTPAKVDMPNGEGPRVVPMAMASVGTQPTQALNLLDAAWMAMGQYFAMAYEGVLSPEIMATLVESGVPKVEMSRQLYTQTQMASAEAMYNMAQMSGGSGADA